jgi:hypothetical protein
MSVRRGSAMPVRTYDFAPNWLAAQNNWSVKPARRDREKMERGIVRYILFYEKNRTN